LTGARGAGAQEKPATADSAGVKKDSAGADRPPSAGPAATTTPPGALTCGVAADSGTEVTPAAA